MMNISDQVSTTVIMGNLCVQHLFDQSLLLNNWVFSFPCGSPETVSCDIRNV